MASKSLFSTESARKEDSSRIAMNRARNTKLVSPTRAIAALKATTMEKQHHWKKGSAIQKPATETDVSKKPSTLNQMSQDEKRQQFSYKAQLSKDYAQEEKKLKASTEKAKTAFQSQSNRTVNYYDNQGRRNDHAANMDLRYSRELSDTIRLYEGKREYAGDMIQKFHDQVNQYSNLNMLPEMRQAQAELERWYARNKFLTKEIDSMERKLRDETERLELKRYEDYDLEANQILLDEKKVELKERESELQKQEQSISGYHRAGMFAEAKAAKEMAASLDAEIASLEAEVLELEKEILGYERAAETISAKEKQTEEVLRLAVYDIEGGKEKLEAYENNLEKEEENYNRLYGEVQRFSNLNMYPEMNRAQAELEASSQRISGLKTEISQTKSDIYQAGLIQEEVEYAALMESDDFAEVSESGRLAAMQSSEDNIGIPNKKKYDYMLEEEQAVYHYLLAQDLENGTDTAPEYLEHLTENLNARRGEEMGAEIREINNPVTRTLATGGYAVASGVSQFGNDFKQLFTDEIVPTTSMEYGSRYIRNDLRDIGPEIFGQSLGQIGYDLFENTAYAAPAMAVSALNPMVGTVVASAASAGDAYNRAMRMGNSKADSRRYAAATVGMEAAIPAAIGAGSSLVNKSLGKSIPHLIGSLPTRNARKMGQVLSSAVGEGVEGAAEAITDQAVQNLILGRNEKIDLFSDEVGYAALSGSLAAPKSTRVPMADYADRNSGFWKNVDLNDTETQKSTMAKLHQTMVEDGAVVKLPTHIEKKGNAGYSGSQEQKSQKKGSKSNNGIDSLKKDIAKAFGTADAAEYEFEVHGRTLKATIDAGSITKDTDTLTREKALTMMEHSEILRNARYMYSVQDEDDMSGNYRRNYFYTPVLVGNEIYGVTIGVRDKAQNVFGGQDSQVVQWEVEKAWPWMKRIKPQNGKTADIKKKQETQLKDAYAQHVKRSKNKDYFLQGFNEDKD